jgi:F-type H+-transporting ATPase subunit b
MNFLSVVLAAADPSHEPNIFGINAGVSFWTLIIFIALSVVLAKFAFPAILGYAAAREQRIQDALDEAARQRAETEQLLAQQRAELGQARQQAQALIAEGKQAAERVRDDMLVRAKAEQEELIARARRDIERERDIAIESLRREAVDLALAAAAKLVGHRVDAVEDRRLVTEYLQATDSADQRGGGAAGA